MDVNHHNKRNVITDHWRRITSSMVTTTYLVKITGDLFIKMNGQEQLERAYT